VVVGRGAMGGGGGVGRDLRSRRIPETLLVLEGRKVVKRKVENRLRLHLGAKRNEYLKEWVLEYCDIDWLAFAAEEATGVCMQSRTISCVFTFRGKSALCAYYHVWPSRSVSPFPSPFPSAVRLAAYSIDIWVQRGRSNCQSLCKC